MVVADTAVMVETAVRQREDGEHRAIRVSRREAIRDNRHMVEEATEVADTVATEAVTLAVEDTVEMAAETVEEARMEVVMEDTVEIRLERSTLE